MKTKGAVIFLALVGCYGCDRVEGTTKTDYLCRPSWDSGRPDYKIPQGAKLVVNFTDRAKRIVNTLQFQQEGRLITLADGDYRCRPEWWWKQDGPDITDIMLFLDTPQATRIMEQRDKKRLTEPQGVVN